MRGAELVSIGYIAERVGVSVSALRFYEVKGLVHPIRNAGGQRRFFRSDVRRVSFILIAQSLGFSLKEIAEALAVLPQGRTPTQRDWAKISRAFGRVLDGRIAKMTLMRQRLDGCIGCGCLSLKTCALYNPEDCMQAKGVGPRFLLGDRWEEAV